MKKITLTLLLLFAIIIGSYAQVSYNQGWEPTGSGSWLSVGTGGAFSRNVTTPCDGVASMRGNISGGKTTVLTSPNIGTSNGGEVVLSFNYKVTKFSDNTVGAPLNELSITTEWANSAAGPWFSLGVIDEANHQVSATCTTKTYNFSAFPGNMFIRFKAQSKLANTLYFYFDNISVTQGAAPSCLTPSVITLTSISNNSANLSWNEITPTPASGYEYYYSATSTPPATAGTATTTTSASFTNLMPDSKYYFWVRSMCADQQSVWFGPYEFTTLCSSFGIPFSENFEADSETKHCWTVLNANSDAQSWNLNYTGSPISGNQSASLSTSGLAGANDDYLITPRITMTGNERLKFNYRGFNPSQPNDFMVKLSTTGTSAADFTTVLMPLTTANYDVITKTISLANYVGDVYVAFYVPPGGLNGSRMFIDDVIFEVSPTEAPACIEVLNVVASETCGNFPTTFTWEAVAGADGYKISIGTSENGQDLVVNNLDLGLSLNYSFIGALGTEYFYTIRPYSGTISAIDCTEDSFTTATDGCYCAAEPSSKDEGGISAVTIGTTTVAVGAPTYVSFVEDGAIDVIKEVPTTMNVTLSTGYAYATNVWIDYNNNFVFEASELVFSGQSNNQNPTILNTSFTVPSTVALGEYTMRVVAKYGTASSPDPCYNGEYGAVTDFLVNVIEAPSCVPPSQTTVSDITATSVQLNWVSTATNFNIEYSFAGFILGSGNQILPIEGNSTSIADLVEQSDYEYYIQSDCGAGDVSPWVGPFSFRTGCAAFGNFTENFTTSIDRSSPECWSTIVSSTATFANVKNGASTDNIAFLNGSDLAPTLFLVTPALTALPLNTHVLKFKAYSNSLGTSMAIGTMTDPTDPATFTAVQTIAMPTSYEGFYTDFEIPMNSSTTDMHIAFKYINSNTFQAGYLDDIIWQEDVLSNDNFENNSFTAYPNPVKNILNVSFTQNIADATVYNLLGQKVLFVNLNTNKGQIDMSNLASGTYLVKVNTEKGVNTIKVIKE